MGNIQHKFWVFLGFRGCYLCKVKFSHLLNENHRSCAFGKNQAILLSTQQLRRREIRLLEQMNCLNDECPTICYFLAEVLTRNRSKNA